MSERMKSAGTSNNQYLGSDGQVYDARAVWNGDVDFSSAKFTSIDSEESAKAQAETSKPEKVAANQPAKTVAKLENKKDNSQPVAEKKTEIQPLVELSNDKHRTVKYNANVDPDKAKQEAEEAVEKVPTKKTGVFWRIYNRTIGSLANHFYQNNKAATKIKEFDAIEEARKTEGEAVAEELKKEFNRGKHVRGVGKVAMFFTELGMKNTKPAKAEQAEEQDGSNSEAEETADDEEKVSRFPLRRLAKPLGALAISAAVIFGIHDTNRTKKANEAKISELTTRAQNAEKKNEEYEKIIRTYADAGTETKAKSDDASSETEDSQETTGYDKAAKDLNMSADQVKKYADFYGVSTDQLGTFAAMDSMRDNMTGRFNINEAFNASSPEEFKNEVKFVAYNNPAALAEYMVAYREDANAKDNGPDGLDEGAQKINQQYIKYTNDNEMRMNDLAQFVDAIDNAEISERDATTNTVQTIYINSAGKIISCNVSENSNGKTEKIFVVNFADGNTMWVKNGCGQIAVEKGEKKHGAISHQVVVRKKVTKKTIKHHTVTKTHKKKHDTGHKKTTPDHKKDQGEKKDNTPKPNHDNGEKKDNTPKPNHDNGEKQPAPKDPNANKKQVEEGDHVKDNATATNEEQKKDENNIPKTDDGKGDNGSGNISGEQPDKPNRDENNDTSKNETDDNNNNNNNNNNGNNSGNQDNGGGNQDKPTPTPEKTPEAKDPNANKNQVSQAEKPQDKAQATDEKQEREETPSSTSSSSSETKSNTSTSSNTGKSEESMPKADESGNINGKQGDTAPSRDANN